MYLVVIVYFNKYEYFNIYKTIRLNFELCTLKFSKKLSPL